MDQNLKEILEDIESNAHSFNDFSRYIPRLSYLESQYLKNKNSFQYELECITYEFSYLFLKINRGKLILNNGEYVDILDFKEKHLEYIEKKWENTNNPFLKNLFSLMLYVDKNSNKDEKFNFKLCFIDSTLKLKDFFNKNGYCKNNDYKVISNALINLIFTNKLPKFKLPKIKQSILDFIKDEHVHCYLKLELIKAMLDNAHIFEIADFEGLDDFCFSCAINNFNKISVDFFKLAKRIHNKINHNANDEFIKECNIELATFYVKLANDEDSHFFVRFDNYCNAINLYKEIGMVEKSDELHVKLANFKINNDFNTNSKNMVENMRNFENKFFNSISFIQYLICTNDCHLIPSFEKSNKYYNYYKENSMASLLSLKTFKLDNNKNFLNNPLNDIEVSNEYKIKEFNFTIYHNKIDKSSKFIDKLILSSFKRNIFSYDILLSYLTQFYTFLSSQSVQNVNLIYIVDILLAEYFKQLNLLVNNEKHDFMLFIDSFVLKLELFIRKLCILNNINTIIVNENNTTSERLLHDIFDDKKFQRLFDENINDYDFLKFVLLKPGLNIRNKAAHGVDMLIYNFTYANLLVVCLLRLLKYF